jgi:hypothetical protein
MASSGAVQGFMPSLNGFRFTNAFPPAPTVELDLGPIGTGRHRRFGQCQSGGVRWNGIRGSGLLRSWPFGARR